MRSENGMDDIIGKLAEDRSVFHMEADFQLALFRKIVKEKCADDICLEYAFKKDTLKNATEDIHVDIWVINMNKMNVAIELKYKTTDISQLTFDSKTGEVFRLKKQRGHTYSRYGFWCDVKRLQDVVRNCENCIGYALFLTNDKAYWGNGGPKTADDDFEDDGFGIYDGRKMRRNQKLKGDIKGENEVVELECAYELKWKPYGKKSDFRYLLLKIPSEL